MACLTKIAAGLLPAALLLLLAGAAGAGCYENRTDGDYVVKGGEVYDRKTDLTWARCSVGQTWSDEKGCTGEVAVMTWEAAMKLPKAPWQLPTPEQLASLVQPNCRNPAIDSAAFPNLSADRLWYWTNAPFNKAGAIVIYFGGGTASPLGRSFASAVRLVRSGS